MNLQLKQYQDEKVEELKNKVNELLELDGSKLCIFEAPTGSGKTENFSSPIKRQGELRSKRECPGAKKWGAKK